MNQDIVGQISIGHKSLIERKVKYPFIFKLSFSLMDLIGSMVYLGVKQWEN